MDAKVETIPDYRIAYVRQTGPYGPANAQAMEQLKRWATEKKLLTESAILLGVPQDNPRMTPPDQCRYDACIVLAEEEQIDHSVRESKLHGGRYAVFTIKHTAEDVQQAWAGLPSAVQNMYYHLDDGRPIMERYKGSMILGDFCELCVPIKR